MTRSLSDREEEDLFTDLDVLKRPHLCVLTSPREGYLWPGRYYRMEDGELCG